MKKRLTLFVSQLLLTLIIPGMKRSLLLLFFLAIVFSINAQTPNLGWVKAIGGPDNQDNGYSVATDVAGNVYTTGWFGGTVDFDPGVSVFELTSVGFANVFISKLDAFGNFVWAKQFSGNRGEGLSISVDASGNIYTTGHFNDGTVDFDPGVGEFFLTPTEGYSNSIDIFISKLDASGNFVWAKQLGGTGLEFGYSVTTDADGNVYTTGEFAGVVDFDPGDGIFNLSCSGGKDIFISKLDASGNFVWAKKIGSSGIEYGSSIKVDPSGNVYTTGRFQRTVDFDPGIGVFNLVSTGLANNDIFISKLNASGNFVYAKRIGGSSPDEGFSLALDASGDVLTTGKFSGTVDFDPGIGTFSMTTSYPAAFILKLDFNGNFVSAKKLGGSDLVVGRSIVIDVSGNVYTAGYFDGTTDFDPGMGIFELTSAGNHDVYISKLDVSGNFLWAVNMGGTKGDVCYSMAVGVSGNIYTTGYYSGSADFDPGIGTVYLTSTGEYDYDIFVQKMTEGSTPPPSQPAAIVGPSFPCLTTTPTYSVENVPGVTYTWEVSPTWSILSGQSTNSISIMIDNNPGYVLVTPSNDNGNGASTNLIIIPTSDAPAQPSVITGLIDPWQGNSENYSVEYEGGVSYAWTFPLGWVQTGGGTTNSVTVTVGIGQDTIKVFPSTPCGTGLPQTLAVAPNVPAYEVNFNVDMSTAQGFDPDVDKVYISGNFPAFSWGEPGNYLYEATRVGTSMIYTNWQSLGYLSTIEYKYYINAGWGGAEWVGGTNRSFTVKGNMDNNDTWRGYISWANLKNPESGTMNVGESYNVSAQAYMPNGITAAVGVTYGLQAWTGYSTSNTDPSTWTNWIAAPFNEQVEESDEFMNNLGAAITNAGTYYYASRFRFGNGAYVYGGFSGTNGGIWDGATNVSGVLISVPAPATKTLNLTSIFLESLYNGAGTMRQAYDELGGSHFTAPTADQITIELHEAANYANIARTFPAVNLSTSGTATITLPTDLNGSYFITIKHRNSVETTTATAVSFAGSSISQSFGAPANVFGNNLGLTIDGYYVIYTGDVDQNGSIDSGDFVDIDNQASNYITGYLPTDINGDGSIDSGDFVSVDNNATNYIGTSHP